MKSSRYLVLLISLLTVTGCTGASDTSEEIDDNTVAEEGNSNEDVEDDAQEPLPEPPGLTILAADEKMDPVPGTYSWSVDNEDGTITATEVDSAAPPEMVRTIDPMAVTSDTSIDLIFEEEPDRYSVRIWDEDNNVISESDEIDLSGEGEVIYEILAHWEQGSATYAFSLILE